MIKVNTMSAPYSISFFKYKKTSLFKTPFQYSISSSKPSIMKK